MDILLIEDNIDLAASIGEYLEARGHQMDFAYDGQSGLSLASHGTYQVLIVDIGLPNMNGLELCRRLRHEVQSPVPILILTARDTLDDKVEGFHAGGDDYLVKPFAMKELEVRLEALYRRSQAQAHQRVLKLDDLIFDLDAQRIERRGVPLVMQPISRKILEYLMRNPNRVISKHELENQVWRDDDPPNSDALRVHIHALRSALDGPFDKTMLHTVRGSGYRLAVDEN